MSNTSDITAFVLVFDLGKTYQVLPYFWLPKDYAAYRQEKNGIPYLSWGNAGLITLTEGDVIDHEAVKASVLKICEVYNPKKVYLDPFNATQIGLQLSGEGLKVEMVRQNTLNMNEPLKYMSTLIARDRWHHGNHPVLNWMAESAVTKEDKGGNIRLDRERSRDKIDGMISATMALAGCMTDQKRRSVYSTREMEII